MTKLIIFVDWFLPGYKGGGVIQSCANLARALKKDFDIFIVTSDRDLGDGTPFAGIPLNTWIQRDGFHVMYLSPENTGLNSFKRIIEETAPGCVYLNSMYSFRFSLLPMLAAIRTNTTIKIVLAPRGMLHKGAIQFKRMKKLVFLRLFRTVGLQKKIIFHATDHTEALDIQANFGSDAAITNIEVLPAVEDNDVYEITKVPGVLKCIFVSRISPKKNLLYLLDLLEGNTSDITLTIIGPVEDEFYWKLCRERIKTFPENIQVNYLGPIPHSNLAGYYRDHHLFVLPTLGENYGHVIYEALANARPVLISDQTPWEGLEALKAGWAIPLANESRFAAVLQQAAGWGQEEFNRRCGYSKEYAVASASKDELTRKYKKLFYI